MTAAHRPRLGFLGVGWIGRNRMDAIARSGAAQVVAVADVSDDLARGAAAAIDGAEVVTPAEVLDGAARLDLDGIVIATPSALHGEQSVEALANGLAVFCQKPLARNAEECETVVAAAAAADRLLGIDLSYRHVRAVERLRELVVGGEIGDVYAIDLVFHNAYGPDKAWFTDPKLSGGGCVIDLGIHLVDLALWTLPDAKVEGATSRLFAKGAPLPADGSVVEDHAVARLDLSTGATATLACSWFLHAGVEADIRATFHGTGGSLAFANVGGSFYDFRLTMNRGTSSEVLVEPPDDWGGRAAVAWAERLASGARFDPTIGADAVAVARVLDAIYGRPS
ncbi:MAG TPA: Gfo/Idh/MocA family oxidoreductase [Acidimicrobiales bacterium]|nr:Gfo/Idh/MocA family oxidoreductase [Acidimicrobiales bacterium]